MTISSTPRVERRGIGLLALVSIGSLIATMMLGLRAAPALAVARGPECLRPMDVVFVIDRSGSMGDDSTGSSRLYEAQTAAKNFVDTLDSAGGVGGSGLHQVGLVSFSDSAAVNLALGASSASDFDNAIDPLNPNGFTNTKAAIAAGLGQLTGSARRSDVDGVAVTHAYVLLSDGRPWSSTNPGSDPNRPSGPNVAAYLAGADQAFSVMLGQSDGQSPPTANTLDPDLMNALAKPAGSPSDNFFAVPDASGLGNIFDKIVHSLLCGDLDIQKDANPTELGVGGGSVKYTYRVSHIGDQGSAPFTDVKLTDTLGDQPGGDPGCAPLVRGSDDPGNDNNLLEAGETWVFTCGADLTKTTQNWGCVDAEYVGSHGARTQDCDDATVVVTADAPSIAISKSSDATGTIEPGTLVTYTYDVENTGNLPLSNVSVTDLISGQPDVACAVDSSTYTGDNGNGILDVGETWTFTCSTHLIQTTSNEACVVADVGAHQDLANLDLKVAEPEHVKACDDEKVDVSHSPEQSVAEGTGTPAESQPDTSLSGMGGGVLPTILFSFVLIGSLGTLAYANVRSMRRRS